MNDFDYSYHGATGTAPSISVLLLLTKEKEGAIKACRIRCCVTALLSYTHAATPGGLGKYITMAQRCTALALISHFRSLFSARSSNNGKPKELHACTGIIESVSWTAILSRPVKRKNKKKLKTKKRKKKSPIIIRAKSNSFLPQVKSLINK